MNIIGCLECKNFRKESEAIKNRRDCLHAETPGTGLSTG